ncbi:MAG: hypothetical protein HUJ52_00030 [Malacoplasma sp.]|nr:hypothetical protein [Malacoplasma sp.]
MNKIKFITSLSSLSTIVAATPIIATSCSNSLGNYEITPVKDDANCVIKNNIVTVGNVDEEARLQIAYKDSTTKMFLGDGLQEKVTIDYNGVLTILPNTAKKASSLIKITALGKTDSVTLYIRAETDPILIDAKVKRANEIKTTGIREYNLLPKKSLEQGDKIIYTFSNLPENKTLEDYEFDITYGSLNKKSVPEPNLEIDADNNTATWTVAYVQAIAINAIDLVSFIAYEKDSDFSDPIVSFMFYDHGTSYMLGAPTCGPAGVVSTFDNHIWSISSNSMEMAEANATLTFTAPKEVIPSSKFTLLCFTANGWITPDSEFWPEYMSFENGVVTVSQGTETSLETALVIEYHDDDSWAWDYFIVEIY